MSLFLNNQQKVTEIIFANRNKSYGAYAIRSNYGSTVFKSLGIVVFTMLAVSGVLAFLSKAPLALPLSFDGNIIPDELIVPIDNSKIYEASKPESKPASKPDKPTTAPDKGVIATQIVDSVKNEPIAAIQQSLTAIGTSSGEIVSNSATIPSEGSSSKGNGTGGSTDGSNGKEPSEIYEIDENPEFEGGLNALRRFVASKLVYPNKAREVDVQGTVHVKFVVDELGRVSNIVLQNNLGYGLDEEAARVVKLIPPFKKPAKIKGVAVKTYYQLPIRFTIAK
jgi:periplasmic protein TonB